MTYNINKKGSDMSKNKCIRHGEILLVPTNKKFKGESHDMFIVGHSETGHHHMLESKGVKVSQSDKEFLIELFEPGKLVHKKTVDKHKTLPVAPGRYQVVKKTEYDPWQGIIREVHD